MPPGSVLKRSGVPYDLLPGCKTQQPPYTSFLAPDERYIYLNSLGILQPMASSLLTVHFAKRIDTEGRKNMGLTYDLRRNGNMHETPTTRSVIYFHVLAPRNKPRSNIFLQQQWSQEFTFPPRSPWIPVLRRVVEGGSLDASSRHSVLPIVCLLRFLPSLRRCNYYTNGSCPFLLHATAFSHETCFSTI